ncbi:unnamed protein product [Danaus chrysippus]|uniref:(African queen) hypothetical protein n=1 Tax=Danaus chrysippus TaxID=151541 RepID=A0A8J2QNA2_9NEOP|nr:unnamed protein product [Danaus chrysippus]
MSAYCKGASCSEVLFLRVCLTALVCYTIWSVVRFVHDHTCVRPSHPVLIPDTDFDSIPNFLNLLHEVELD